ncbi:sensor histidine kinase [Leptolinea tardivitalis]|uniref:sensor histidine kinase n=1 Tax=Leptolinea tardivitalis TaxID=229920 RepID=UPI0007851CD2|nr:ATP-binding protein [Leptolinea tardivitalis]GAP20136.1 histidine kinase [Leptolinea tardivitalis]
METKIESNPTQNNSGLTPESLVPRLGEYLIERGLITAAQLTHAIYLQKMAREKGENVLLGQILVNEKMISKTDLDQAITEQIIQLRSALQSANASLELRVKQRTAELEAAMIKLADLNRMKANIVANISHELRTPMTHIKGYLELMITSVLGPLTDDQQNALKVMQKASDRLERLIEDLLLFSDADGTEVALNLQPIDMHRLGQTLVNRARIKAEEKHLQLDLVSDTDLPKVQIDEEKISWAIGQLLDNAIKFTPSEGKVELNCTADSDSVKIIVKDTGIGIPADRFDEIFEPFHQLDGSSTRRYGGTGLGLALVRKIIEAHGSVIRIRSAIDQGSEFEFTLRAA